MKKLEIELEAVGHVEGGYPHQSERTKKESNLIYVIDVIYFFTN